MEDLEYFQDFIIDNKNMLIVDVQSSTVLHFNFKDMCFRENNRKTVKPIMWDSELNEMLYWLNQRWVTFSYKSADAVKKLYNNQIESILLGNK